MGQKILRAYAAGDATPLVGLLVRIALHALAHNGRVFRAHRPLNENPYPNFVLFSSGVETIPLTTDH